MAVENKTTFGPVDIEEVAPGRYIRDSELQEIVKLANLVLQNKVNILAYSMSDVVQDGYTDTWSYHWAVRTNRISDRTNPVRIVVLTNGNMDWDLLNINYSNDKLAVSCSGSSTAATPGEATFYWRNQSMHPSEYWVRFQLHRKSGFKGFYGFIMYEDMLAGNPSATLTNAPHDLTYLDSEIFNEQRSLNVLALRALINNIEGALSGRSRGCAHVYPRDYAPTIGSVYFRGFGPFRLPINDHCSRATVVMETFGGSIAHLRGKWLSTNQKRSFDASIFYNSADIQVITPELSNPRFTGPWYFDDINVTPGEDNDFFFFFVSDYEDSVTDPVNRFKWSWEPLGQGSVYEGSTVVRESYFDGFAPFTRFGYHVELSFNNEVDGDTPESDSAKLTSDPLSIIGYGAGTEVGGVPFDFSLMRRAMTGRVAIGLSPYPKFLDDYISSISNSETDALVKISLHQHGFVQVLSVWINEEMDPGAAGFGASAIIPRGMPSASHIRGIATMLNTFATNHMPVFGMGVPTMQGSTHLTYGYMATSYPVSPIVPSTINRVGNWQIYYAFGERFEEPIDSSTLEEDRLWQRVGLYPFLLNGGRAVHDVRGSIKSLKITVDYQACISQARGDSENDFNVSLVFLIFLSQDPKATMRNSAGSHFQRLVHVVDLTGKVFRVDDIDSHTRWAGFAVGGEAGRTAHSANLIQGTQLVAWPSEVLEDGWPWDREIIDFPLGTFAADEMPPEHWYLHVCVSYYSWVKEGPGARQAFSILTPTDVELVLEHTNAAGCVIIPCVSVAATPYEY